MRACPVRQAGRSSGIVRDMDSSKTMEEGWDRRQEGEASRPFKAPTGRARRSRKTGTASARSVSASSESGASRAGDPGPSISAPVTPILGRKRKGEPLATPQRATEAVAEPPALTREEVRNTLERYTPSPEGRSAVEIWEGVGKNIGALESFRVLPTRYGSDGVPLRNIEMARHAFERIDEAVDFVYGLAAGSDTESRGREIAGLRREVSDLKAEVARLRKEVRASHAREERLRSSSPGRRGRKKEAKPMEGAAVGVPDSRPRSRQGQKGETAGRPVSRQRPARPTPAVDPTPLSKEKGWDTVERRKRRKVDGLQRRDTAGAAKSSGARQSAALPAPKARKSRRTVPQTAAVTITVVGERSYAEVMKGAREKLSLTEYGIDGLTLKRARNGGYLFEVAGADWLAKADRLARDLEDVLCGEAIVAGPVKSAKLRVTGLDDSVTPQEVERAICATGECAWSSLRMGNICRAANGLEVVWVRCPLASALRLEKTGCIMVGWTHGVVGHLEERPLQCYRCLLWGHTAAACKGQVDRSGRCFNCGGASHVARGCTAKSRCPLCDVAGEKADHSMGGQSCAALKRAAGRRVAPSHKRKGRRGKGGAGAPRAAGGVEPLVAPRVRPAGRPPPLALAPATGGSETALSPGPEEELFTWEQRPRSSPVEAEMTPSGDGVAQGSVFTIDDDPSQALTGLEDYDWDASL